MWKYEIYECDPMSEFYAFTIANRTACIEPMYYDESGSYTHAETSYLEVFAQICEIAYLLSEEFVRAL